MKILLVHNFYQQRGGECVVFDAEKKLLENDGHEVETFLKSSSDIRDYTSLEKLTLPLKALYGKKTKAEVDRLVREFGPDIAHVHNVFPLISPSVYESLSKHNVPIVQTIHNFRFMCPNGLFFTHGTVCEKCKFGKTANAVRFRCFRNSYILSAFYAMMIGLHRKKRTFSLINHFIALSDFSAAKLKESGICEAYRISVLGNFIDINPANSQETKPDPKRYFLIIGRLSIEKGVSTAIKAFRQLPDYHLKIAGDGSEKRNLQKLACKLNVNNVEFLGHVSGETKKRLFKNAVATIIPSLCYENFPITVLESFKAQTPVIASNTGSLRCIIQEDETGLLFRPGDHRALQIELKKIIQNPKRTAVMGRNAEKQLRDKFTPEIHIEKLIEIYRSLIK